MIHGSCSCGSVRFAVETFASDIYKCHCSRCRKMFGGASSAAALAYAKGFVWTQGKELRRGFQPPGSDYKTYRCSNCGSLTPLHLKSKGLYFVPMGLLDSDPGIPLTRHIHLASKAAWELLDDRTEKLEEGFEL